MSATKGDAAKGARSAAKGDGADGAVMPAVDGLTPELLPDKDKVYYNDYSTLVQQQGMLQDHVRTSIYQVRGARALGRATRNHDAAKHS